MEDPTTATTSQRTIRRTTGRRRRGISLMEAMVTIAIVLTISSILMLGVMKIWQEARAETTRLTLSQVGQQVEVWRVRHGRVPERLEVLGPDLPADGWGNAFGYLAPAPNGAPYALVSLGRDGAEGGTGVDEDLSWAPER